MTDTTDIVERLREGDYGPTYGPSGIEIEAADTIERLRSQLKEMAEALEPFANMTSGSCAYIYGAEMLKARSALSRYRGE